MREHHRLRQHRWNRPEGNTGKAFRSLRNSLIIAGVVALAPPVLHPENTARFFSGSLDCTTGVPGDYTNLGITTGGITHDENGQGKPNAYTARRERAAAHWLVDTVRQGRPLPDIWLLNGNTAPEDRFVERDYFKQLVWEFSGGTIAVPDSKFRLDEALNTTESVRHFARDFHAGTYGKAALFTDGPHSRRLSMLACAYDIPSTVFVAEDILVAKNPSLESAFNAWRNSPYVRYRNEQELRKRRALLWFPHGGPLITAKEYRNENPDSPLTQWLAPPVPDDPLSDGISDQETATP